MYGQSLNVAMSVAPDLRPRAGAGHKRIVRRHSSIVVEADDLAVMIRQILRRVRVKLAFGGNLPIAEGQKQVAVAVKRNLSAEVVASLGDRLEQLLHAGQPVVLKAAAYQRGPRLSVGGTWLRVAQVDEAIGGEVRMGHDFEQSAL